MNLSALREKLKSGSLQSVYVHARRVKRRLRGESLVGTVPIAKTPLNSEELRAQAALFPDEPRLYFSLALNYVEDGSASALASALECLDRAEALGFPSPERIALYKAVCAHRQGQKRAEQAVFSLPDYEWTTDEKKLCDELAAQSES